MIKIKLQERRTISASNKLADILTEQYKKNFLSLIVLFLQHKYSKTGKQPYLSALEQLKEKYPSYLSNTTSIGKNDFASRLKNLEEKISYTILQIPAGSIVPYILEGDTAQKALISARIDEEEAEDQILAYFRLKQLEHIDFDLELSTSEEKFGALMDFGQMTISILYDSKLFKTVLFYEKDINKFLKEVESEVDDTKRKVYHELQHLFVDIMKNITGFSRYGHGPRSSESENVPNKDPEEIQTYAQEAVTIFAEMIEQLNIKNKKKLASVKKAVLKIIINSSLTPKEEKLLNSLDQGVIQKYIKMIKGRLSSIKKYDPKFYNYALSILYTSVNGQLQENIIMNKIKVVLKENNILAENLTKEEIRKLVRDEFEKLLKDRDSKKEIAKITKEFVKKFYRELSFNSTHIIDQIDV